MNIVKGVVGLIRRSSGSHGGESSSGSPLEKFSPPTPLIHFRVVGEVVVWTMVVEEVSEGGGFGGSFGGAGLSGGAGGGKQEFIKEKKKKKRKQENKGFRPLDQLIKSGVMEH
ncbi:hypothetical protein MTR67_020254 [Solanum verrucosum]|uniref:Uncharacterized protein n=1 Tax=Solanum verrucosum TaxID=315347 RepID=A0AAF0QVS8_SOLVR|nr:hypothetical protein MTR67_020254 [Solanum verrucosum]